MTSHYWIALEIRNYGLWESVFFFCVFFLFFVVVVVVVFFFFFFFFFFVVVAFFSPNQKCVFVANYRVLTK